MPLKLPDIVKHPILCRYCSIEIPISQAALKVKPNDFDTIRTWFDLFAVTQTEQSTPHSTVLICAYEKY